jgi:CubicO group peptidase (beta-lactamase class C family)
MTSFSTAKSLVSALVGAAIDDGAIGSVEDPITEYLPELGGRGLDEITIADLLAMASGIRYDGEAPAACPGKTTRRPTTTRSSGRWRSASRPAGRRERSGSTTTTTRSCSG